VTEVRPETVTARSMGTSLDRVDGAEKVTGQAAYAADQHPAETPGRPLSLWLVQSTVTTPVSWP
jgi:xanthine dehydrogenase YagR molybdenum-binding subunit